MLLKNPGPAFGLLVVFWSFILNLSAQNCTVCGSNYGSLTPTTAWQTTAVNIGGSATKPYFSFSATNTDTYYFSFCSDPANGGSTANDLQLTIVNTCGGTAQATDDDACTTYSLAPDLTWVAPSSGTFYLIVTMYSGGHCQDVTSSTSHTLAYKKLSSNTEPSLSSGAVSPTYGSTSTFFRYSVTYTDAQNNAPSYIKVGINGTEYAMVKDWNDNTYTDGCLYVYDTQLPTSATNNYYFTCSDGIASPVTTSTTSNSPNSTNIEGISSNFGFESNNFTNYTVSANTATFTSGQHKGTYAARVGPLTATAAGPSTILSQNFENGGSIPAGWSQEAGPPSWIFGVGNGASNPSTTHGGSYNAYLKDATAADNLNKLISPSFDLSTVTSPTLKFWHTQQVWVSDQDKLKVFYKTSAGGSWTLIGSEFTSSISAWTQETLTLPSPSATYYIAFEGNAKYGYGVCIDDVTVTGTPPPVVTTDYVRRTISIPAGATNAKLNLFYSIKNQAGATDAGDAVRITVQNSSFTAENVVLVNNASGIQDNYAHATTDVTAYAGQTIGIEVKVTDDGESGTATYSYLDDISVNWTMAGTSTVSSGAGAEPATISSIINTQGASVLNFDFSFLDDGVSPATDATASQISQIVFNQGTGNDITTWTDAILGAELNDGSNSMVGTVNAGNITFSSIANSAGQLGYIGDNASKTFTLKIWLKTSLGGSLPSSIEGQNFVFQLTNSSFAFDAGGLETGQSVNSGSTNNAVSVVATKITYTVNKPPSSVGLNSPFRVLASATDVNGNTDVDNVTAVTLVRDPATGAGSLSSATGLTQSLVAGTYEWTDVIYNVGDAFKIQASGSGLGNNLSILINCVSPPGAFNITAPLNTESCTGNITVSWSASAGAVSYNLYYCTGSGCDPTSSITSVDAVTSPYTFNASTANTIYRFAVMAVNEGGTSWTTNNGQHITWNGYTWKGTTNNWSTATNWCGGSAPTSAIDVIIPDAAFTPNDPTLSAASNVRDVTINSGGIMNAGSWNLNVYGDWSNSGTFNPGTGTITCIGTDDQNFDNGSGTFNNFTVNKASGTVTITNNTLDINGNIVITSGTLDAGNQNINLAGNWTSSANFTPGSGTVTFDGSGNSTIIKNGPNITVYSTGFEDSDGGTGGWILGSAAGHSEWRRLSVAGVGNAPRTGTYDCGSYNLVSSQSHGHYYSTNTSNNTYIDLSRTIDLSDVKTATMSFWWYYDGNSSNVCYSGYLLLNGITVYDDLENQTAWQQRAGVDLSSYCGTDMLLTFRENLIYQGSCASQPTTGAYGMSIDDISITGNLNAETFNSFKVNKSGAGIVYLATGTDATKINVEGNLEITSGTLNAQGNRIRCGGDFVLDGTFVHGNNEVVFNASSSQKIRGSQNITFYQLSKNSSSDLIIGDNAATNKTIQVSNLFSWTDNNDKIIVGDGQLATFKIPNDLNIYGSCTLETRNSSIVDIAKNYTNYGTLVPNNGMVKFTGTAVNSYINREPSTILYQENFETGTGGWTLGGVAGTTIWERRSGAAHNSSYDCAVKDDNIKVPYDYYWGGAVTIDLEKTINLTGFTNAELQFWWRCGGEPGFDYGRVLVNGNIVMDNMHSQPTYAQSSRIDISQYANGNVTIEFRFISDAASGTSPGLCIDDIVITGTSSISETFYDLTVDKSTKSGVLRCPVDVDNNVTVTNGDLNSSGLNMTVGGNWTNSGTTTFTHGNNTVTLDGNASAKSQTITNNSVNKFYNVILNNPGGTATLSTNRWYIEKDLTITSGTINSGTQDIYILGNWTNNGGVFQPQTQTVFFRGSINQTVRSNASPFYNLSLPSTKTNNLILADDLTITNDLTLTGGLLDVNTNTKNITIAGDWFNDGGGFITGNNSTSVTFNGAANQKVNKKVDLTTNPSDFSFDNIIIDGTDVNFYVNSSARSLFVRNFQVNENKTFKLNSP